MKKFLFVIVLVLMCVGNSIASEKMPKCASKRLYLSGEIKDITFVNVMSSVVEPCLENGIDATLWISSEGGSIEPAIAIYDGVKLAANKNDANFKTVATGQVASAAVFIFLSGSQRLILPNATILIHEASINLSAKMTLHDLTDKVEIIRGVREAMINILVKETNLTRNQAEEFIRNGKSFNAQEAVNYGFADKILE